MIGGPGVPPRVVVLRLVLVALIVAADIGSKAAIMPWLEARMDLLQFQEAFDPEATPSLVPDDHGHLRHPVVGGSIALMHNLNYGAAFGKLNSIPWVLVIGRAIAALVLFVLVARAGPHQAWHVLALIFVLAGCLGNLWDNLTYQPLGGRGGMPFGPVRDFIDVYFPAWDWHFPTFNIADSAISLGAVLLIFGPHQRKEEEAQETGPEVAQQEPSDPHRPNPAQENQAPLNSLRE